MPSLIVKTPPAVEPVSVDEARAWVHVDITDDDLTLQGIIRTARTTLESKYDVAMITQSLVLGRDYFPNVFGLGYTPTPQWWLGPSWSGQYDSEELRYGFISLRPPIQSVTSVTYLDPTGAPIVWPSSNYILDADSTPGRLSLALNKTFPTTAPLPGAVKVEFVTGYARPELVPDDMKTSIKLLLGEYYENRENVIMDSRLVALAIPDGVDALMAPYGTPLVR